MVVFIVVVESIVMIVCNVVVIILIKLNVFELFAFIDIKFIMLFLLYNCFAVV